MTHENCRSIGVVLCVLAIVLNLFMVLPDSRAEDAGQSALELERPQLRQALDLASKSPVQAEKLLETLHSPSAKAYQAYLYMSGKIAAADSAKKVDTLMHEAAVQVCPTDHNLNMAEQDVAELKSQSPHYSDISDFLHDFRTIVEFDNSGGVSLPPWLFKEHPLEAFAAFGPRYGSSLDHGIDLELAAEDDIGKLPAVSSLLTTLDDFCGTPSGQCEGTVRFMFGAERQKAILEAALAPEVFLAPDLDIQSKDAELKLFMEAWSNEELWNKQKHKEWLLEKEKAAPELQAFYLKHLKLDPGKSMTYAKAAVNGISIAFLGSHERALTEKAKSRVNQIFSRTNLSRKKMTELLSGASLSGEELAQALRLAILNNAELDVIDFLIKQKAVLSDGKESALFMAVLRPDVETMLISAGARVNETNPLGKTALIQAAQYNALETMKILLSAGADLNHSMLSIDSDESKNLSCDYNYTIGSRTALMYAAWFADLAAINYLLEKGAKQTSKDSGGDGVISYLGKNKRITEIEKTELTKKLNQ